MIDLKSRKIEHSICDFMLSNSRLDQKKYADKVLLESGFTGKELKDLCHEYLIRVFADFFYTKFHYKEIPYNLIDSNLFDKFSSNWASYIENKRNVCNNFDK